jgi:transcription initiation factor IIE alpha subunit
VNKNPKLRLKNSVRAKFSCLKCGKNLELRSFKSRKIIHNLEGLVARAIKNESKIQNNLK